MPQLDGLRAIAILMIFVNHWTPWSYQIGLPWGNFGVDLFFVLSGFLITEILLESRRYMEEDGQSLFLTLRQFYIRRTIRIFPLYYAFLIVYGAISQSWINELTPWLWTYTLNLFRVLINSDWGGPISHLWSLSVEEQFYLVWPWIILLTPRRFLLPVLLLSVAAGPATKIIFAMNGLSDRAIRFFTLSCLDTLALGGLLAYAVDRCGLQAVVSSRITDKLLWIGLPIFLLGVGLRAADAASAWRTIVELSGETLLCGWTVIRAAQGFRGAAGRVLASPQLVYLGRISYGLYLLHKPIPMLFKKCGIGLDGVPPVANFVLYTGIAVLIASLSWYLFEGPINALKRYFPYRTKMLEMGPSLQPAFPVERGVR
jgi:peptidoglycan/LPS O-acetylase OafA/YrhL